MGISQHRSWRRATVAAAAGLLFLLAGPAAVFATTTFSPTGISTSGDLQADGNITMNSLAANALLLGQNGATPDVVTIAGDVSITDSQWNVTAAGVATFASVNGMTLTPNADGFTLAGGTTSRAFTLTGGAAALTAPSGGSTLTLPTSGTLATLAGTETLTNKTLTAPTVNGGSLFGLTTASFTDGASHTLNITAKPSMGANGSLQISAPLSTTMDLGGNLSTAGQFVVSGGSVTLSATGLTGVTLPTSGTLATLAGSETLSNKTLTTPTIASFLNSGTLTMPTGTDTLVARNSTDTLTNKTLTSPRADLIADSAGSTEIAFTSGTSPVNFVNVQNAGTSASPIIRATGADTNISLSLISKGSGAILANGAVIADTSSAQSLFNKTFSSPLVSGTLTLGSAATDPTGANGMTFYNSTSNKFRCFENSAWKDCDTTGSGATLSGTETLSNKTLVSPKITNGLFDENGASEIAFNATAGAVNGFTVFNSGTGSDPSLLATGTDASLGMRFEGKGTGGFLFFNTTVNADLLKLQPQSSGANSFIGAITSVDLTGNRTWTFPDADGTVTVLGNSTTGTGNIVRAISPSFGAINSTGDVKIFSSGTNELRVGDPSGTPVHVGSFAVASPSATGDGTGVTSASMTGGSTDTAGQVSINATASTAGSVALTFAQTYTTYAPFCVISPASATAAADVASVWVTSTAAKMTVNLSAAVKGGTETWNYNCVE